MASNSSSFDAFSRAKCAFIARLAEHGYPDSILSVLRAAHPWSSLRSPDRHIKARSPKLWLKIRGHPLWTSVGLASVANRIISDDFSKTCLKDLNRTFSSLLSEEFSIGCAWKLAGKHYSVLLRRNIDTID